MPEARCHLQGYDMHSLTFQAFLVSPPPAALLAALLPEDGTRLTLLGASRCHNYLIDTADRSGSEKIRINTVACYVESSIPPASDCRAL